MACTVPGEGDLRAPLAIVPVHSARGASRAGDAVVAIDINTPRNASARPETLLFNRTLLKDADIALRPTLAAGDDPHLSGRERADALVEAGRGAARGVLRTLRRRMLPGIEQGLAELVLRHGFAGEAELDACIDGVLTEADKSLGLILCIRRMVSPAVLSAMLELAQRKMGEKR